MIFGLSRNGFHEIVVVAFLASSLNIAALLLKELRVCHSILVLCFLFFTLCFGSNCLNHDLSCDFQFCPLPVSLDYRSLNCSRINIVVLRENALIALVEQPFPSVPVEQPFPGSRCLSTLTGGTTISQSDWWNNHFPVSEDSSGAENFSVTESSAIRSLR